MNQRADFDAERRSRPFQSGLQVCRVKFFEHCKSIAHDGESRFVLRHKMFQDSLGVVLEVILEIEAAVSRQLAEDAELSLARFERGPHIIGRKL